MLYNVSHNKGVHYAGMSRLYAGMREQAGWEAE